MRKQNPHFPEIIKKALLGEEIVIAKDHKPLVKIVPLKTSAYKRKPGSGSGQLLYLADDFDEIPEDFRKYR